MERQAVGLDALFLSAFADHEAALLDKWLSRC